MTISWWFFLSILYRHLFHWSFLSGVTSGHTLRIIGPNTSRIIWPCIDNAPNNQSSTINIILLIAVKSKSADWYKAQTGMALAAPSFWTHSNLARYWWSTNRREWEPQKSGRQQQWFNDDVRDLSACRNPPISSRFVPSLTRIFLVLEFCHTSLTNKPFSRYWMVLDCDGGMTLGIHQTSRPQDYSIDGSISGTESGQTYTNRIKIHALKCLLTAHVEHLRRKRQACEDSRLIMFLRSCFSLINWY